MNKKLKFEIHYENNVKFNDSHKRELTLALDRWAEILDEDRTIKIIIGNLKSDGIGRVLGAGSFIDLDRERYLPSAIKICVDEKDIVPLENSKIDKEKNSLYYFLLHELGHGFGIGSLWNWEHPKIPKKFIESRKLVVSKKDFSPLDVPQKYKNNKAYAELNPVYIGKNATEAYRQILIKSGWAEEKAKKINYIPIEDTGEFGTIGVHWDEHGRDGMPGLSNEILTGYLNPGVHNPISEITIGALKDLGWNIKS